MLNALLTSGANASLLEAPQAHEVALLPEYCKHAQLFLEKFGNRKEEVFWSDQMGRRNFQAIHHYCWAMVAIQRANRAGVSANVRLHNLNSAVSDIDYVLQAATTDFVLLPELWTRRGEVLLRIKRHRNAEESFEKAIKIRPDYWPAYVGFAQTYLDQGKKVQAREIVNLGLKHVSDRRALERMLREMQ